MLFDSTFINIIRGLSCLTVFLIHFQTFNLSFNLPWKMAHGAVIVFFVLSGYLIHLSAKSTPRLIVFAQKRLSRIYSVFLPALVFSILLSRQDLSFSNFFRLLLFVDPFHLYQYINNEPIWSLTYEVYYYIIFAFVFYLKRWSLFLLPILPFLSEQIFFLFPCWLCGAALVYLRKPSLNSLGSFIIIFFCFILFIQVYIDTSVVHDFIMTQQWILYEKFFSSIELGTSSYFLCDWVGSFLIAIIIIFSKGLHFPNLIAEIARWFSQRTYSIYIIHYPLMIAFSDIQFLQGYALLSLLLILFICILFSEIFEIWLYRKIASRLGLTKG